MLDLAWSEIALVAVVALVVIGPKDLPTAVRGVAELIRKARRMAGEFQGHLDEVVREAKLDDVRDQFNAVRNFDLKGEVERAVDADGSLRRTVADDPFRPPPPAPPSPFPTPDPDPAMAPSAPPPGAAVPPPAAPAFIPPGAAAEAGAPPVPSVLPPGLQPGPAVGLGAPPAGPGPDRAA